MTRSYRERDIVAKLGVERWARVVALLDAVAMNASARLRWSSWLFLTVSTAVCCTKLDNAADHFIAQNGGAGAALAPGSSLGGVEAASDGPPAGAPNGGDGGYATVGSGGEGAQGSDCFDQSGFDGLGCFRCEPKDILSLENACTSSKCVRFDNDGRLPLVVEGKLPELPTLSGAGGSSGSMSAGSGGSGGGAGTTGVPCASLSDDGVVIYVTGSTAVKPFLQQVAQQLAVQKVFVVYTSVGSCAGVDAIVNGTLMRTGAAPLPASATYWDSSSSTGQGCDLAEGGVTANLGISDVFAASCSGFELANLDSLKVRDAHGPIQTMTFAVPSNSRYTEISQQAAYMVFGFGKDGKVLDHARKHEIWNDESALLQRSPSSGTQAMLAAAIGVPSAQWRGKPNKGSDDVANALQAAAASQATADAAIGILGADYIDSRNLRAQIRMLAYQDSHQVCAVTSDSSETAKDKRNVRDGHYPIWGPLHLLYKVDAKGDPQDTAIRSELINIVGYLSGSKALPNGLSLLDVYAQSGLVPECAMRVSRSADGGALFPARPAAPCSCLFEKKATGTTTCVPCKVQGECGGGETCSQGYCEAL